MGPVRLERSFGPARPRLYPTAPGNRWFRAGWASDLVRSVVVRPGQVSSVCGAVRPDIGSWQECWSCSLHGRGPEPVELVS